METKTIKAKKLFLSGNVKEALRIFKTFRIGITSDEKRTFEIAYECMVGKEDFYQKLGVNTTEIKSQSLEIIRKKYL